MTSIVLFGTIHAVPRKILHVSEAFGGGIVSSLYSFATSTPEYEHHLLVCERRDESLSKDLMAAFSSLEIMERNIFRAIAGIRSRFFELNPDFLHLHSSYAGVFGRLSSIDPDRIIYSPHGFSFERQSDPALVRCMYYLVEKYLSSRSSKFAGVSLDEVSRAKKLRTDIQAFFVPNTSDLTANVVATSKVESKRFQIACAGRLCPQKDPKFLIRTLAALPERVRELISFTWIGSGDLKAIRELVGHGVRVTGWLTHTEAVRELEGCDLYYHVAAWEGFPMTVIEAAALGRPILLRKIRAFNDFDLPSDALVLSPEHAARCIEKWVEDVRQRKATETLSKKVREITSVDRQRAALRMLYENASA